jgi:PAS domain S-box-containing protein
MTASFIHPFHRPFFRFPWVVTATVMLPLMLHAQEEVTGNLQPGSLILIGVIVTILAGLTGYLIARRMHASAADGASDSTARALLSASADPSFLLDAELTILAVNDVARGSIGLRSRDIVGKHFFDFFPSDDSERRRSLVDEAVRQAKPVRFEDSHDGRNYEHDMVPIADGQGCVIRIAVSTRDVTQQKLMESTLRNTSRFLRQILESSRTVAIIGTQTDGPILFWNAGAESILGYSSDEVVGKRTLVDFIANAGVEGQSLQAALDDVVASKRVMSKEFPFVHRSGEAVWMKVSLSPQVDPEEGVLGVLAIAEDITQRLASQRQTEHAEQQLSLLAFTLNCAKDAFVITDMENIILYVNQSFLDTYGFTEEELIGRNVEFVRPEEFSMEVARAIREGTRGVGWSGEVINRRKNGELFPVELWTSVVRDDAGRSVALVGVAREITERKRVDEKIKASLQEKEVLLKEVHHRVKNNLQVISSILSLQGEKVENQEVLDILRETQNRVRSMALVHEELYQSDTLSRVDIGDYVRRLSTTLFHSYRPEGVDVHLELDIGDIRVPVDDAVPCGLIINELVSNALKYAFAGRKRGKVAVIFHEEGENFVLRVVDNGVGVPRGLDLNTAETLGLQLVATLTRQLRGSIECVRRRGTTFTMTFPISDKEHVPVPPDVVQA